MPDSVLQQTSLRILIVEGSWPTVRSLLSPLPKFELIQTDRIMAASHLYERSILEGRPCDALVLDLTTAASALLPEDQGLDAFRLARALFPGLAIITIGPSASGPIVDTMISEGAQACLDKADLDGKFLRSTLEQAVLRNQAEVRRFRALFNSAPMGILLAVGRRVIMANPQALITFGRSEKDLSLLSVLELFPSRSRSLLERFLDNAEDTSSNKAVFEAHFPQVNGKALHCRVFLKKALLNNAPAVAIYITPQENAMPVEGAGDVKVDALLSISREEKMKALGRLAGGVAHDFNNLLTAINGYSEHLLHFAEQGGSVEKGLKAISRAGEAAADLSRRLLAFSNVEPIVAPPLEMDSTLQKWVNKLEIMLGPEINLEMHLHAPMGMADIPEEYLEQMVLNLCANAKEAMPQGGVLLLSSKILSEGEIQSAAYSHLTPSARPGLVLSVEDSGQGMPPEILQSLCEPFFSTKRGGRGTGLGLSTVYGTLKKLAGGLSIESRIGQGTRFNLFFPRSEKNTLEIKTETIKPGKMSQNPWNASGNGQMVLIVDDDSSLREMLVAVLERFGYKTLEANSAYDALEIIEQDSQGIDLVLTDVMLRGDGGHELGEKIKLIRPGLQTLYISGHSLESLADQGIVIPAMAFLEKPFTPVQLANKVLRTLAP